MIKRGRRIALYRSACIARIHESGFIIEEKAGLWLYVVVGGVIEKEAKH